ncbi:hypothetical protein JVT61DRAFT_5451 [Boletus reticuloceps]|uniref:LCCL domain-containing protein n=1 Tax=Boletus reticuloceps TaxID=495285 RepID=A0A8I2YYH6_9AGAM|nr:hypothetical protein JVT61DRAFT_5451 [Boletus reticuloceps]
MAAPPNVTTKAMSGRFIMNKALSSDADDILRLQGVSWFKRRAISMFTLTLRVKHHTGDDGVEHIDIDQTLSGGITGTSENRALDWHERDEYDDVFGHVTEKSRRIPVEEITDEFLKKDWTQDTIDDDVIFIDSWSAPGKNSYTWRAVQTWGFGMVNGERRHVRYVTFTSPQKQDGPIHVRLVYDYNTAPEKIESRDGDLIARPQHSHRFANFQASFASKWPRLHRSVQRAFLYVRGPRPKRDLPNPIPLLGRTYTFRGYTLTIALEPALLRATRPFTAPWLFVLLAAAYIIGFAFFTRAQWFLIPSSSFVDCTSVFWTENAGCGLNGELCAPFTNTSFDFRCPAQCASVVLLNPRLVGNVELDFVPLLVGGGDMQKTYRGDSFICSSAIQAGLISDSRGGCASVQLVGNFTNYLPVAASGLTSVGFPSVFPLSFRFSPSTSLTHCADLRNFALAFNILITCVLFLILRPKSIVLYWCLVCIGFWHIALFSQPQGTPPPLDVAFGAFLPTLFVCYGLWKVAIRFTLPAFANAPFETMIWYLAPYWTGVLTNLTTAQIPIDRLTAQDITQRPGGLSRTHYHCPHLAGHRNKPDPCHPKEPAISRLQLRLHHYIISMALFPGTGFPTRLSAIYQGFLLGMFLNDVAGYGFASILQTAADLVNDGPTGSPLPTFLTSSSNYNAAITLANQTISWAPIPGNLSSQGWNAFSLLVDDVERYVGSALNFSLAGLEGGLPHFFRLAYASNGNPGDFTMPATLWPNGTWTNPLFGPS